MVDLIQHPMVQAVAWALVHFVWQGAAIAACAAILMRAARTAQARYVIGVMALAAMIAAPAATFLVVTPRAIVQAATTYTATLLPAVEPAGGVMSSSTSMSIAASLGASPVSILMAGLVALWLVGVAGFSIRLAGGWLVARRLARETVRPAAAHVQALASGIAERLGLRRVVLVLESSTASVPVLIGWFKPVVVLPVAALAGLNPEQLEAVLAHEFAHVRRHDFLVNLLQSIVEALLFYHPAVWWLSRRVRAERERSCDDIAVGVCDRLVYATALTDLATMATPRLALAATDGDLLSRVRRLLGQEQPDTGRTRWFSSGVVALVVAVIAPVAFVSAMRLPPTAAQSGSRAAIESPALEAVLEALAAPAVVPEESPALVTDQEQSAQQSEEARRIAAEIQKLMRDLELRLRATATEVDAEQLRQLRDRTMAERDRMVHEREAVAKHLERAMADQHRAEQHVGEQREAELKRAIRAIEEARQIEIHRGSDGLIEAQIAVARKNLERSQELAQKGLVAKSQLDEMKAVLALLEQKRDEARKHNFQELPLKQREDLNKLTEQITRMLALRGEEMAQALKNQADIRERARELAVDRRATIEQPNRAIMAGDVLRITIEGEPELPSAYRVREDGTVRVPFLGVFKVAGQTSAQVAAAIGKQLADKRLGTAKSVSVALQGVARVR